jgi:hypothetical protein
MPNVEIQRLPKAVRWNAGLDCCPCPRRSYASRVKKEIWDEEEEGEDLNNTSNHAEATEPKADSGERGHDCNDPGKDDVIANLFGVWVPLCVLGHDSLDPLIAHDN